MNIFVQTAGSKPDQDYRWVELIKDGSLSPSEPTFLKEAREWLDMESPSLLLWRSGEEYRLLILNLVSQSRFDYRRRCLRNNIAIIGSKEDEKDLVTLAIIYLENQSIFEQKVDECIVSSQDNKYGFYVDLNNIFKSFVLHVTKEKKPDNPNIRWLGKPSLSNKEKLAKDLHSFSLGPDTIVIVTSSLDPKRWDGNSLFWWGLTELAESDLVSLKPNRTEKRIKSMTTQFWLRITSGIAVLSLTMLSYVYLFEIDKAIETQKIVCEQEKEKNFVTKEEHIKLLRDSSQWEACLEEIKKSYDSNPPKRPDCLTTIPSPANITSHE